MPETIVQVSRDFRLWSETVETTPARVASLGPKGTLLQDGGHRASWQLLRPNVGNLPGSSLSGSGLGFRTPLEGTFSKTIMSVMPTMLLQPRDFRNIT